MRWKAICDRCGFTFYNDELRREWDGLMVCTADFEQRNAQDFVRGVQDKQNPPWVRPEPADVFTPTSFMRYNDGSLMLYNVSDPLALTPAAMAYEGD